MSISDSDGRPGHARMVRAFTSTRAITLLFAVVFGVTFVVYVIGERDLEMLVGNGIFFAVCALVLWAGFREQRRTHLVDSAQILGGMLSVTSPDWSGAVAADQVVKVKQMRRNPMNVRELPRPEWRHWIRIDLLSGSYPGATTLYVWNEHPVALLTDLSLAGFPVKGRIEDP